MPLSTQATDAQIERREIYFAGRRRAVRRFRKGITTLAEFDIEKVAAYRALRYGEYRDSPMRRNAAYVLDTFRAHLYDTCYRLREDFYMHKITETQFVRGLVLLGIDPIMDELEAAGITSTRPTPVWYRPFHDAIRITDDKHVTYSPTVPHTITEAEGLAMCPDAMVTGEKILRRLIEDFK